MVADPCWLPGAACSPPGWGALPALPSFEGELIQGGGSAALSLASVQTQVAPEVLAHLLLAYGFRFCQAEAPAEISMQVEKVDKKEMLPSAAPKSMRKISDEIAKRVQNTLRLALVGIPPEKIFAKFDKDKDGLLSADEFRRLVRMNLRIPADKLSDADVAAFVAALDDDGNGTLGVAEVLDFVERGTATFFSGPEDHLGPAQPHHAESPTARERSPSVFAEGRRDRESVERRPSAFVFSRHSLIGPGGRALTSDATVDSAHAAVSPGQRAAKQRIARSVRARRPASAPGFALPRSLLVDVASRSVTPVLGDAGSSPCPPALARPSSRASARSQVSATPSPAWPASTGGSPSPYAPRCPRPSTGSRPRPPRPQSSTGFASFKRGALDKMLFGDSDASRKQWVHDVKVG